MAEHKRTLSSCSVESVVSSSGEKEQEMLRLKKRDLPKIDLEKFETLEMIADCSRLDSVCWISSYPVEEFSINWDEKSAVSSLIDQQEIEKYCKFASGYVERCIKDV